MDETIASLENRVKKLEEQVLGKNCDSRKYPQDGNDVS